MNNINNISNADNNAMDPRCRNLNFPMSSPYYPLPPRTPTNVDLEPAINNWAYFWTKDRPYGYWMHVRDLTPGTVSYFVSGCVLTRNGTTLYVNENLPDIDNFIIYFFPYY